MVTKALAAFVRLLHQSRIQHGDALTDADLLERFIGQRDEEAFEALVRRHGPMVLGVCRRILHNEADVEDCFQATFLVLVRRAASVRPRGLVGNWLYGTARNVALKARTMRDLRHKKEREAGVEQTRKSPNHDRNLQELLDQELQALPDKYRAAIVLCDLEGMTVPAAAKEMGCPLGTLSARLVRGRAMLAKRLARHGLTVSGGVLAAALCQNAASACVPGPLVVSTVQAAISMAAGKALATGVISAKVVALTEGVLKAMLMTKLKVAIAVLLAVNIIGAGVGLVYCQTAGSGQPGQGKPVTAQKQQPTAKADGKDDEKKDGGAEPKAAASVALAKADPPEPLPENIVTAWKEAGATVGWLRVGEFGSLEFVGEKEGKPGYLPAFYFAVWHEGRLANLPDPASAFGLDLHWFPERFSVVGDGRRPQHSEVTDAGLKELAGLKSLQALGLARTGVTDAGLKELAGLKSLQALDLGWTKVTGAGLKELAGLKSLQTLYLYGTQVTDAGLKELAGLKSLQSLNLEATQVTDAGLKELAGLKSLQSLNLGGTPVTDAGLKELAGLKSLQTLDLGSTKVTDAGLKELAGLKSLQSLNLGGTPVTDAGLKELAVLESLQSLNLGGTPVTDAGLKELAGLKSLQRLVLPTHVTDAGLKELAGLKSLQSLNLAQTKVTDAGLKELAGLKLKTLALPFALTDHNLKHYLAAIEPPTSLVELYMTKVTDAGLKELAGLKSLQSLSLGHTLVTDAGLKELAGLKSLQVLDLGYTLVTDAGLKELTGLKSLQSLNLSKTKVTDAGLKELAGLKSLQSLSLYQTQVTDAGLKELAGLKLKTLALPFALTDHNLKHYLAAIESPTTLYLNGTQVTDAGLKELAGLKSLQVLDLSTNRGLTDAGLKELAGLKSLQSLWLNNTPVTDAGLKELAGLKSLQTLWLNNTPVTDAGLKELAGLKSLQTLDLGSTKVTDAGLKELAGLKSLQTVHLHNTKVTDAGLKELQKALPGCRTDR